MSHGVRLLVGHMGAGQAWCRAHDVNPRSRFILYGVTATEVRRHLLGRDPKDVTITYVHGAGFGPEWAEARNVVQRFQAMGATVNVWVG